MTNSIVIAGTEIHKIEYSGQQVVTFAMIDKVHQRPEGTAKRAFNENRDRFDAADFIELTSNEIRTMSVFAPRTARATLITKRGYLKICKTLGDDRAWEVFDEMIERYFAVENAKTVFLPNFLDPAEAARAWAEQYQGRVEAERRKAEIGSRREATAMATASVATRKANKLERELDRSMEYATVKRMAKHYKQEFEWTKLRKASNEMELASVAVFDANYGTVKAYHADVWKAVYGVSIPSPLANGEAA